MLIRAEDESVYNLNHIERFEIVAVAIEDEISKISEGASERGGAVCEAFALRAYIAGQAHDLVGPTPNREEAETALHRIFNMVSERADLHSHRPNPSRSV